MIKKMKNFHKNFFTPNQTRSPHSLQRSADRAPRRRNAEMPAGKPRARRRPRVRRAKQNGPVSRRRAGKSVHHHQDRTARTRSGYAAESGRVATPTARL